MMIDDRHQGTARVCFMMKHHDVWEREVGIAVTILAPSQRYDVTERGSCMDFPVTGGIMCPSGELAMSRVEWKAELKPAEPCNFKFEGPKLIQSLSQSQST